MKRNEVILWSLSGLTILVGCDDQRSAAGDLQRRTASVSILQSPPVERWYGAGQIVRGNKFYLENCAECHRPDASGAANWKEPDEQGNYPPPPLNGTAHTWHHPLSVLRRTVRIGGVPLGGSMPGFADKLNEQQIDDIFAWVQSHWSDEIYTIWHKRNLQSLKKG
ncbi:MAG: cytochrome c [Candidatus Thiodiazotropha sp. (ex Epidulcina cf. delphinae)]|nr:cytochrome c [Candidatus Thiodiazotropha sp. (ex Epidulcina cf. delphinae)]